MTLVVSSHSLHSIFPPALLTLATMATQPSSSSPPSSIKVLTLNVWGLAHISKARQFRIGHIADRIAEGDWDVVALQEIWVESDDWRMLRARCSDRLQYSKFFLSGAFGSGLAILSRFPIRATHTHPYTLNGLPIHVGHGDWFVGKAAGSATLDLGDGFLVDVFDTHVRRVEFDQDVRHCLTPFASCSRPPRSDRRCWRRKRAREEPLTSHRTSMGAGQTCTE